VLEVLKLLFFPFWFAGVGNTVASGVELSSQFQNVFGQARIEGLITSGALADPAPGGSTPGYPRVEFSPDGVNIGRTVMIPQDPNPYAAPAGQFAYPIDVRITDRFVRVKFRQSSGSAASISYCVSARPDAGGPPT
jgi:hypothetical protein